MSQPDCGSIGKSFIGRPFDSDWGLEDPTGKSDEVFKRVIAEISDKLKLLVIDIQKGIADDRLEEQKK